MKKYVSVKAYDGTIVRISEDKLEEFNAQQELIKHLLSSGKSLDEVIALLKEGASKWVSRV